MQEETLLELVESGDVATDFYCKTDENLERAVELELMGFSKLAKEIMDKITLKDKLNHISKLGYIKIPLENIEKFLDKKVERYNREHETKEEYSMPFMRLGMTTGITADSLMSFHIYPDDNILLQQPIMQYATAQKISRIEIITRRTCDYAKYDDNTIGRFEYEEIPLDEYNSIPPEDVLDRLKDEQSKKLFDYFTIGHVKQIKDPILFGRVEGSTNRYFICQWGEDISLDDII